MSTNVGGVPEVLPSPDMIVLCDPKVDALVDGLVKAVERQTSTNTAVDPVKAHQRITQMYSWGRVAKQTIQVYDRIIEEPSKSFMERLACYLNLGGFSGIIACILASYIEIWIRFVVWIQPQQKIDVVPDLVVPASSSSEAFLLFRSGSSTKKNKPINIRSPYEPIYKNTFFVG